MIKTWDYSYILNMQSDIDLTKNRVHLAILIKKYLDMILISKTKTIESRFIKNKNLPFHAVNIDDKILLKESGGLVRGECFVENRIYFDNLTPALVRDIFEKYNDKIRAEKDFIESKLESKYATLIWMKDIKRIDNYRIDKKDQRAWMILSS